MSVSMCRDRRCPSRATCVRYRAEPSPRQAYFEPTRPDGERCPYYAPADSLGGFRLRDVALVDLSLASER